MRQRIGVQCCPSRPAVVLAHGTSASVEMVAIEYARAFARTGLVALIHDHRNFGHSDGQPRFETCLADTVTPARRSLADRAKSAYPARFSRTILPPRHHDDELQACSPWPASAPSVPTPGGA